jgi:hypothetical protein
MPFIRINSSILHLSELNGKFRNESFLPINSYFIRMQHYQINLFNIYNNIMILDSKSISNNYSILLHANLILTNKANFK